MKHYLIKTLFWFGLTSILACNRHDSETIIPSIEIEEPIEYFDSHYVGLITNENQQAIVNCDININGNTTTTSANGVFSFVNAKTNKAGNVIAISKDGYFDQYLFVHNTAQSISNLKIELVKKNIFAKINSSQTNNIALENNISLTIPANAFSTSNANPYTGQINLFYNNKNFQLKNIPFVFNNLQSAILENSTVVDIIAEDQSGNKLYLNKPLTIEANMNGKIGMLDIKKDRWQEIESIKGTTSSTAASISNLSPIIVGSSAPKALVTSQIKLSANIDPTFVKAEIVDAQNHSYTTPITQDGTLRFYVAQDRPITIYIRDFCDNIIATKSFRSDKNVNQTLENIVLNEPSFKTLISEIKPCEEAISIKDMVYGLYEFDGQTNVIVQYANAQTMTLPKCLHLNKVSYFRGTQKLYSINLDQSINNNSNLYLGSNLFCVPKLSGIIKINNSSIILNSNQYKIYREGNSTTNLTITNFNGFVISIDNVTKVGKYKANGVIFNNPAFADCFGNDCNDLSVEIKKIGNIGDLVSLSVKGSINGLTLDGEFTNKLSN